VEAIAPGDEITGQFLDLAVRLEMNRGRRTVKSMHAHIAGFENDLSSGGEPGAYQILDDLMLGVDRDRLAAGELVQVDAMAAAVESQLDSMMNEPFAFQALSDARFDEHVHRALLEHACPDAHFDIFPAANFDNDGFDPP
jgi:hypothetical protein